MDRGIGNDRAKLAHMEQALEKMISKSKASLLKYIAHMTSGASDPAFMSTLFASWRLAVQEGRAERLQNDFEEELKKQANLHKIKLAEDKEKKIAALGNMGFKSDKAERMKYFLLWLGVFQKARQMNAYRKKKHSTATKIGMWAIGYSSKDLLGRYFREWQAASTASKSAAHRELFNAEVDKQRGQILSLREENDFIHQQLTSVMDTLQKELKTKEELANELRDALDANSRLQKEIGASFEESSYPSKFASPATSQREMRRNLSEGSLRRSRQAVAGRESPGGPSLQSTPVPKLSNSKTRLTDSSRLSDGSRQEAKVSGRQEARLNQTTPTRSSPGLSVGWDTAIPRLRDQGLLQNGPRL